MTRKIINPFVPPSKHGYQSEQATDSSESVPLLEQLLQTLMDRRRFLGMAFGAAVGAGLVACGSGDDDDENAGAIRATGGAADVAQPSTVFPPPLPPGTEIAINDGSTAGQSQQLRLRLAGLLDTLPFEVSEWTNLRGGPEVINGFRSGSMDLATNAGIPPIQAHYMGDIEPRIVGVSLRRDPTYVFVTRPGSDIQTVADFKGKKLAYSEGQAQGIVLLRAVIGAGIDLDDVDLVPLTSVQFVTALQARQVDIAVIGQSSVFNYLNQYEHEGARVVETDVVDLLSVLWAPGRALEDSASVAAIAAYVPIWAKGTVWEYENPETWLQEYYKQEGLSREQGESIVAATARPIFPISWDEAIAWEQETADLMAEVGDLEKFDASTLFDRRFERLAAEAISQQYWT